jgi:eukaryotic-like serine/threonine-protein kinase
MTDAPEPNGTDAGTSPTLQGARIGTYVLTREIASGAAATVYLAEDTKHRRQVALKLLHGEASSALGSERFRREIEVVAQLQHPHILPLHDSGELEGRLYYVMPLVSGETLRDRIARTGALPLDEVRRITTDVAAALDYAHRRGVIHRDVKPANILIDDEHAIVADFGIAHLAAPNPSGNLTGAGLIIGTPTYMSPEQATGCADIDARTDIYALGCVVFEMLTGTPPFGGQSVSSIVANHLQAPVPSARDLRSELPPQIDGVLRKALAKEPADRYASARDLGAALGGALDSLGVDIAPTAVPAAPPRRRRLPIARLIASVLAVAAIAVAWLLAAPRYTGPPSVAVLPFTNMSGNSENEYVSDGITEELTGALVQLGGIRVTPRTTAFGYKGRTGDIRRIGRELGVKHIVEGSVRRGVDSVRVVVTLLDARTGERLMDEVFDEAFVSVLQLQIRVAARVAERLQRRLRPGEDARLASRHSGVPGAYDAYMNGRYLFDQRIPDSLLKAAKFFQHAIDLDTAYGRAHAGLADTYSVLAWLGVSDPRQLLGKARASAQRAVRLNPDVAESHVSLGLIHTFSDWDWRAAESEFTRAIELDSSLAAAQYFRAWALVAAGQLSEALSALKRAEDLDRFSVITKTRVATLYAWTDSLSKAETALRRVLAIDSTYAVAHVSLARTLSMMRRHDEALAALPPDSVSLPVYEASVVGAVYARAGRDSAARAVIRRLRQRPYVAYEGIARVYAALRDYDRALAALDTALSRRGVGLILLGVEPMFDEIRGERRFVQIRDSVHVMDIRRPR